jgi:hypothetical protein
MPRLVPLGLMARWLGEHGDVRRRVWPGAELVDRFLALLARPAATLTPNQ